jgi:hypothetical protein
MPRGRPPGSLVEKKCPYDVAERLLIAAKARDHGSEHRSGIEPRQALRVARLLGNDFQE